MSAMWAPDATRDTMVDMVVRPVADDMAVGTEHHFLPAASHHFCPWHPCIPWRRIGWNSSLSPPNTGVPPPVFPPIGPPGQRIVGPPGFPGAAAQIQNDQPPYSNTMKRYANWNACYSCGFDVADGHTSMSCPPHLRKATHDINFNRQNAQQYIDLGHPCATHNRHKTQFPTNM
jgi:hypothetical protein